jgi:hypothetical protein
VASPARYQIGIYNSLQGVRVSSWIIIIIIIIIIFIYLTAIGLSPGGSGYFTCMQIYEADY